jgi:hypothetical protein
MTVHGPNSEKGKSAEKNLEKNSRQHESNCVCTGLEDPNIDRVPTWLSPYSADKMDHALCSVIQKMVAANEAA